MPKRVWAASQPRGKAAELTPAEVVRRMKAAGVSMLSQSLAADIGEAFGVSEKTVYLRLKRAKELGLLS